MHIGCGASINTPAKYQRNDARNETYNNIKSRKMISPKLAIAYVVIDCLTLNHFKAYAAKGGRIYQAEYIGRSILPDQSADPLPSPL